MSGHGRGTVEVCPTGFTQPYRTESSTENGATPRRSLFVSILTRWKSWDRNPHAPLGFSDFGGLSGTVRGKEIP